MHQQKVALVLGGTNPHIALIENLKKRGYHTVLVDYLENPPAKEYADEHLQESTLDKDKVHEIAKTRKADLVIATCIDQANVTACYVAEKLNLPRPYSYEIASEIADKTRMKKKMLDNGIPTAKYIALKEGDTFNHFGLKFPLVIKPSDSNGSKGVRRVDDAKELNQYQEDAFDVSRNKKVVVEEFIEGDEIGVDCIVSDGITQIITMHKKRKPKRKDGSVIFSIGSISPPAISQNVEIQILNIASTISRVFNLNNTPLLLQVIVNNEDVKVVEFAPRIGGGLNFRKIQLFKGYDIINASVESYFGEMPKSKDMPLDYYYSENHIYTEPGVFGRIEGIDKLIEDRIILEFYQNKRNGMLINASNSSSDRVGSFIVQGNTIEEIKQKLYKVYNTIKVIDSNNEVLKHQQNYKQLYL
ncbi:MAG: ATP-grasp domain-containing protein [Bacteroidetes bacterium]|nr:MAG: ATP-grasp domain-containing protein [Bacteroidota bacterium]